MKCRFLITDSLIEEIKLKVKAEGEYTLNLPLQYENEAGVVSAVFTKSIYVASKTFYKQKLEKRK